MFKTLKLISIILFFFSLFPVAFSQADSLDSIRIVTYYPSPFGTYRELRTKRLAIGDDYIKTGAPPDKYDWQEYATDPMHNIGYDADLVVQGNVGIGTTTPSGRLHLMSNTVSGADYTFNIQAVDAAGGVNNNSPGISFINSDGTHKGALSLAGWDGAWAVGTVVGDIILRATNGGNIIFANSIAGSGVGSVNPRVCIINNGNVGIGTMEPQAKLHISGTAGTDGIKFPDGSLQTTAASATPRYRVKYKTSTSVYTIAGFSTWDAQFSLSSFGSIQWDDQSTRDGSYLLEMPVRVVNATTKTFYLGYTDNTFRFFLDGSLIAGPWDVQGPYTFNCNLSAGNHTIQIIFTAGGGPDYISLYGDIVDNVDVFYRNS